MIYSDGNVPSSAKRLLGLRLALRRQGEDVPDESVLHTGLSSDPMVKRLLPDFLRRAERRGQPLTALLCFADATAFLAAEALREMGLRVPEDISLVGFDDSPEAAAYDPPLTSVSAPMVEYAALAAQLMRERLHANGSGPRVYSLPCRLVVRQSTAPPPERTP